MAMQAEKPCAIQQNKSSETSNGKTRYIQVVRWNDYHDWPPPGGMRHLIFHCESNGFSDAFLHVGRTLLVDEAKFFSCLARQPRGKAAQPKPRSRRKAKAQGAGEA